MFISIFLALIRGIWVGMPASITAPTRLLLTLHVSGGVDTGAGGPAPSCAGRLAMMGGALPQRLLLCVNSEE